MKKILVLGSLNMDLVTRVQKIPKTGETLTGEPISEIPGGKGANQAVALGKLGAFVKMSGMIGKDDFGDRLLESLKSMRVDTHYIQVVEGAQTGTALVMVNEEGDNAIVVIPGANSKMSEVAFNYEALQDTEILLSQLEIPLLTIEKVFRVAKDMGIYTVLNPAPANELSVELCETIDLLVPNETEFFRLTGCNTETKMSIRKGADILLTKGVKALIITLGEKGSVYITKDKEIFFQSYKVKPIDTTAAGDSFIGGLLLKISQGKSIEESIPFASKVAALTVTRVGAQISLPSYEDVELFNGGTFI